MSYNQPPNGPGGQSNNPVGQPGWHNPPHQPYDGNPYAQTYSQSSNAVLALILSILGTVCCCTLMAPVGLYLGKSEMKAIDGGYADPSQRGMAQAAFVLGIIGTSIMFLGVLYYGLIFAFGI